MLLVELLFSLLVSNAKVERMFSLMKPIKMDGRFSLSEKTLSTLIRICMEGSEPEFLDHILAMTLWNDAVKKTKPSWESHLQKIVTKKQGLRPPTPFLPHPPWNC